MREQKPKDHGQFDVPAIQSMAKSFVNNGGLASSGGNSIDGGASQRNQQGIYDGRARAIFGNSIDYGTYDQMQPQHGQSYTPDYSGISEDSAKFLQHLGKTESGNNYYTGKNDSGYEGKYQFRYRDAGDAGMVYANKMGVSPEQIRQSPQLQEKMMQMALGDYDKEITRRGYAVNNYNRWLRHNQGGGGMNAILSGNLTPIIRRNLRNQGVNGATDVELINAYHSKFRPKFA